MTPLPVADKMGWIAVAACLLLAACGRPALDRDWRPELARMPEIVIEGDTVTVRNVRRCRWRTATDFDLAYGEKTFRLSGLESLWFAVEPFSPRWPQLAHTLVSFGFADGDYLSVSVEARMEAGETWSAWGGLWRRFELMYIVADEADVIPLRTRVRGKDVHLYRVHVPPEAVRSLFLAMLKRAEKLGREPEHYHTFFNNCTSNIVGHVNDLAGRRVAWGRRAFFPGYTDGLARDLGWIKGEGSLEELRARHRIAADASGNEEDFSRRMREGIP